MRLYPIVAASVLAFATSASAGQSVLQTCSGKVIGQPPCDPVSVADAIDMLSAGNFGVYRDAGMESFAMHTALLRVAEGLRNRGTGGDCIVNDEAAYAAGEIWSVYVSLPSDADATLAGRFRVIDGLFNSALTYVSEGIC